jgi:hypothetical protein
MTMLRQLAAICAACATLASSSAPAAEREPPPPGSELQLFIENDMLANTDRYYTNGLKVGIGLPLEPLQSPAAALLRSLDQEEGEDVHVGLFLGQNIYTPRDISISAAQPNDRPWSAWLYLGAVAQRARENRLHTVEIDVGMVGPAALGEAVQSNWHRLIGVGRPKGWDNQGPNEPAFMVSYLHKRKYGNDHADIVAHAGASLGTVMTNARVGGLVRLGHGITGFGPDTIEPGGAMLQGTRASGDTGYSVRHGREWYVFAGVDQRAVARNIFLDGPAFHGGPSVDRRDHVFDTSLGFSFRYHGLRFSWTRIRRSEEFRTATGGGGVQRFDSMNLGYEF